MKHKWKIPGHALHEPFPEMVEGNCYLHVNVLRIIVAVSQEHDLHQLILQLDEQDNNQ